MPCCWGISPPVTKARERHAELQHLVSEGRGWDKLFSEDVGLTAASERVTGSFMLFCLRSMISTKDSYAALVNSGAAPSALVQKSDRKPLLAERGMRLLKSLGAEILIFSWV